MEKMRKERIEIIDGTSVFDLQGRVNFYMIKSESGYQLLPEKEYN